MLASSKIIAFVGTTKPEESRRFYQSVLGLQLVADEPSALVFDSGGTMLRVSKVDQFVPPPFTVLGWDVADIQQGVEELEQRGAVMERFESFNQDEHGIMAFPDGTLVAWFRDPAGNMLSLTQFMD